MSGLLDRQIISLIPVNLSISDVVKAVKTLINSIGSLFQMLWDFCTHILDYVTWLLTSIADTLSLLVQLTGFATTFQTYLPPFANIFFALFLAGLTLRVVLQVI